MTLRKRRTELRYWIDRKLKRTRTIAEEPSIIEFKYWRLIKNRYPYDARCSVSHMLLPKRVFADYDVSATFAEQEEFKHLKKTLNYDFVLWNMPAKQTQPKHFHVHLLTYRKGWF